MGISTWSMHYTGMLAFRLPIPMEYYWPTAFLSYLASFCTSALGLFVVSRRKMGFVRAFTASIFMGGGVAAMHYTAMASMRLRAVCHYSPALVTISVVLAIVFSLMSLWLMFLFREEALGQFPRKVASAVLLGAAIAVMHYTGMASASFIPCAEFPDLSHALPISALGIPGIAVVNLMIVVVVLLTSLADRLQKQKALLDELFEQAPQAVALMGVDHRILRVNKEFSRVFGYSSQEALGRRISELIAGQEAREEEKNQELAAAKSDVDGKSKQVAELQTRVENAVARTEEQRRTADELEAKLETAKQPPPTPESQGFNDTDAKELFGARDLHIVDVFDVDTNGETRRTYGRVYFVEKKLLIFYAFDLQDKKHNRAAAGFQAWGYREANQNKPESLGLFNLDDSSLNRWVLKVSNPRVLERIDAVYVTLEPPAGSPSPRGRKLLYANLVVPPNHP